MGNKITEEEKRRADKRSDNIFIGDVIVETIDGGVVEAIAKGVVKSVQVVGDLIPNVGVVDFLKDKFNIVGDAAVEVATKLPQAVVEKIESFDGEGLSNIASAVSDTIKSIELPDIDFPDIDI